MPEQAATETNPFPESAGTLLEKWGKLRVANQARNMLNNQRISNNCHKQDTAYRELGVDMLRWENERAGVKPGAAASKEEDMEVRFDSPQTITNNHHYPPAAPAKGLGTLAKLAVAGGLIATGAGAGAAIPFIVSAWKDRNPPAVQPAPSTDTDTTGELMLWPPRVK